MEVQMQRKRNFHSADLSASVPAHRVCIPLGIIARNYGNTEHFIIVSLLLEWSHGHLIY